MKFLKIAFLIAALGFLMPMGLIAQDFVYKPINSNFGGDQYNYNWLLNSANQQNRIEDSDKEDGFRTDPLDDFEDNLNRQILNQLSSRLVNAIFGESGEIETGTFNLGNYQVDIFEDGSGITVNVQDIKTGNFTNVVIPNN